MKAPEFSGPRAARRSRSGASRSVPSSGNVRRSGGAVVGALWWNGLVEWPLSGWDKGLNGWMGKYFTGSTERSVRDKNTVSSAM